MFRIKIFPNAIYLQKKVFFGLIWADVQAYYGISFERRRRIQRWARVLNIPEERIITL